MIEQRFRSDYPGEFVVLETRWANGKKEQKREWIDNPIDNQHISGRAAVIGSNIDKTIFDYTRLQKHRGGLLGKKRLQTYATNNIWKEMQLDFAVETEDANLTSILETTYATENIVYTSSTNCIRHPGEFYLIPFNPRLDMLALPIYLAAFDGHQEIFLLGYNNEIISGTRNWKTDIDLIFKAYPSAKFYLVGVESNMPDIWRKNRNVACMLHRDFITYCDV